MLAAIDPSTSIGVRDYAIVLLFWGNTLRRGEIANANIEDFTPATEVDDFGEGETSAGGDRSDP